MNIVNSTTNPSPSYRKLFYFLLTLIVLRPSLDILSPFTFIVHPDLPEINIDIIIGAGVFIIGAFFFLKNLKSIRQTPLFFPILIFSVIIFSSIFYSINQTASISEFIRIATIFLLYFLTYHLIRNQRRWQLLITAVLASYILPAIFAIFQFIFGLGLPDDFGGFLRIYGTFAHPNPFSFYTFFILAVLILLILSKSPADIMGRIKFISPEKLKIFLTACALTAGFLLFATYTRSALLCFFLFIILLGILKYKQLIIVALALFGCLYFISPVFQDRIIDMFSLDPYGSIVWRFRMWQDMLPLYFWHPIIGHGLGAFTYLSEFYRGLSLGSLEAHNDYLKITIENGALGLISFLILIIGLIYYLYAAFKKALPEEKNFALGLIIIVLSIFGISLLDNVWRGTALMWNLWILAGGWLAINSDFKPTC